MIFKYLDLQGMEYLCKKHLNGDYYKGIKINSENFNELLNLILKVYKNKINNFYGIDYEAKEYLKNFLQIKDAIENARMDVSKTIYDKENKMELDKRIKDNYRIFTCFDAEQAKQYVDTKGYFTDDIDEYRHLGDCYYGTLSVVNDKVGSGPYLNKDFSRYFSFFLPEEFIKQRRKKYRPYTMNEFQRIFMLGQPIRFRHKKDKLERLLVLIGYETLPSGNVIIQIGNYYFTLKDLFNDYEWQAPDTGEFKPFGVEEC